MCTTPRFPTILKDKFFKVLSLPVKEAEKAIPLSQGAKSFTKTVSSKILLYKAIKEIKTLQRQHNIDLPVQ